MRDTVSPGVSISPLSVHMKGTFTVVTLNEQLYSMVKEFQWENHEVCSKICHRLGKFRIAKNVMKAIGQHYTDSRLQSVWAESSVFDDNTASNNMSAKSYNQSIRAHKLTLEALWLILWSLFLGWAKEQGFDDADLQRLSKQLAQSLDDNVVDEIPSEVMQQLEDAVQYVHLLQLVE